MDKLQVRCWIMALGFLYYIWRSAGGIRFVTPDNIDSLMSDLESELAADRAEIKFDLMSEPELSEALRSAKR